MTQALSFAGFSKGYVASDQNLTTQHLALGTKNVRLDDSASVLTRPGYQRASIDLGRPGQTSIPQYVASYDITYHALSGGGLVYEKDGAVYDTGMSLVADSHYSMASNIGDVYLISQNNPLKRVVTMETQVQTIAGGTILTVRPFEAARLTQFGITSGTLYANNAPISFSAVNPVTGQITIPAAAVQINAGTTVTFAYQVSPAITGQLLAIWETRLYIADRYVLRYSVSAPGSSFMQNIVDFATSPAGDVALGQGGTITALQATDSAIYAFKESESYYISSANVDRTSGEHNPQFLAKESGCAGPLCVTPMGGFILWYDGAHRRVYRSKFAVSQNDVRVLPDEKFDLPIRKHLKDALAEQVSPHAFFSLFHRLAFVEIVLTEGRRTFVFDVQHDCWVGFDTGKRFRALYETPDGLYATSLDDDTVYLLETGRNDDGGIIDCTMCFARVELRDGRTFIDVKACEVSGEMGLTTTGVFEPIVNSSPGTAKTWVVTDAGSSGVSTTPVSESEVAGATLREGAEFDRLFIVYPAVCPRMQPCFSVAGDAEWMRIDSITVRFDPLPEAILTSY